MQRHLWIEVHVLEVSIVFGPEYTIIGDIIS